MKEIWKDIEGYEGRYQVSNFGNVKSLNYKHTGEEKIMQSCKDKIGYLHIKLFMNGKPKMYKVHRLVAQAFIPNSNNYPQVNHKDENKINNNVNNLEWCTAKYNSNFGTRKERLRKNHKYNKGEKHPCYGKHHSKDTLKKMSENHADISNEKHPRAKKVICITTNEKFNCIKIASEKYNANQSQITKCCKGTAKSAGKHPITNEKLVWEYYPK